MQKCAYQLENNIKYQVSTQCSYEKYNEWETAYDGGAGLQDFRAGK